MLETIGFSKMKFYDITDNENELVKEIENNYKNYTYLRWNNPDDRSPFLNQDLFVVGCENDEPLIYASCYLGNPSKDVGWNSLIDGLNNPGKLFDLEGTSVLIPDLKKYEGFRDYTGKGNILHLGIIDCNEKFMGKGFGTEMIDYLKGKDSELIELLANGPGPTKFFENNEFINSGISNILNEISIMSWHNPQYK
jgi:hypothetical protein